MTYSTPPIPLPTPTTRRWQPLRLGLVELYYYDVEEFWFRDGHLMLRGNNGTGKSKVLSLTLPFLLDANLSASRVEPDGDRSKRMEWNLLMNKRHERRVGYAWLEFGRVDEAGNTITFTLGCGLRAVAGRANTESWFFVTQQRIGEQLWLTTSDKTALSRERLIEAIGPQGQVFPTAQAYRRAVDEKLFRLGTERYEALVDTLIQLRQPQLSKDPDESRLSDALTHALRPLDRGALEDVAESMSELADIRRDVEETEAMRKSVAAFARRYRHYAQIATRRHARSVRQAQTDVDNTSRKLSIASTELDEARQRVARHQAQQQHLEEQLAADDARVAVLRADPVMRDAARLASARERAAECRSLVRDAADRKAKSNAQLERENTAVERRRGHAERTGSTVLHKLHATVEINDETNVLHPHFDRLRELPMPHSAATLSEPHIDALLDEARESEARRREQIAVIRTRLRELQMSEQQQTRAADARALRRDAFDQASEAASAAAQRVREGGSRLIAAWRTHVAAARALRLPDAEALFDELENWHVSLSGANPMRAALQRVRQTIDEELASRAAALSESQRSLTTEQDELGAERSRLEAGEDQAPPAPPTRNPALRARMPGAPLWQLVDFALDVPDGARKGLESALESSGLLDAWVLADGQVVDPATHDVLLTVRPARQHSLAQWLIPSVPDRGAGAAVSEVRLNDLLLSIDCSMDDPGDAETWISPTGQFRVGTLRGAWAKERALYIGHAARAAARHARLEALAARLKELAAALASHAAAVRALEDQRGLAREEYAGAPTDDELLRQHADNNAAERQRRGAQVALGSAESALTNAEQAVARARDSLTQDARDLDLPTSADELERTERRLGDYRLAISDFGNALRQHRSTLQELLEQEQRQAEAIETLRILTEDHREKQLLMRGAIETAETLQATTGKQVAELLGEIEATVQTRRDHDDALRRTRAELVVIAGQRGTAEQKHTETLHQFEERVQYRKSAAEALQTYAQRTGFVTMAIPDLVLPAESTAWTLEMALGIARRAEQALTDTAAEDTDWQRVQRDIGNDLTELQGAMSAQGHAASAEPSDQGLLVRIIYQQRPERPDALEQRLETQLAEQRLVLSVQERALLEEHLEKEIAANLQRMIRDTQERVAAINIELHKRPTSTGMRYRLVWDPRPDGDANAVPGLEQARKRLLNTSSDAWSSEDRTLVGRFLQARIEAERLREEQGTLYDSLARALDYRRWHRFTVERHQDRQWRPLSGPASSGERALGLTVPLFAAASSHYQSADPHAPRLVLLDEAFAGIDDEARAGCMGLIHEFDLDFVMTSEREWGCYKELPGLAICQIVRREGMDAIFVSRWSWDGRERRAEPDAARRFPEAAVASD